MKILLRGANLNKNLNIHMTYIFILIYLYINIYTHIQTDFAVLSHAFVFFNDILPIIMSIVSFHPMSYTFNSVFISGFLRI